MSDESTKYTEEEMRAFCAGQIKLAAEALDRGVLALVGERVRVYTQGTSFVGQALLYDGHRVVLQHDTKTCTIVWLESGVVLSEVKGESS